MQFPSILASTDRFLYILATRCDDGNNRGCGKQGCIQTDAGVNCSCNIFNSSDENNTLAKGRTFNEPQLGYCQLRVKKLSLPQLIYLHVYCHHHFDLVST